MTVGWTIMIILSIASTARVLMIPADDPDEGATVTILRAAQNQIPRIPYANRTFFVSTIRSTRRFAVELLVRPIAPALAADWLAEPPCWDSKNSLWEPRARPRMPRNKLRSV